MKVETRYKNVSLKINYYLSLASKSELYR